ncbi:MAG TPA: hypothetical protein VFB32_00520 [Rudaea sp.]|nr:hypothetical protein [Rudaea sp.]
MDAMRAVVYTPPEGGFPYLAVIFHSDGSVAFTRPFRDREDAQRYVANVAGTLVKIEAP